MKKTFLYMIGAIMALTACTSDDDIQQTPQVPAQKEFSFQLTTEAEVTTRAGGGTGATLLQKIPANCVMNIHLEVYVPGSTNAILHEVRTTDDDAVYTSGYTFSGVRLPAGNSYTAVFWASFQSVANGEYYDASDLQKVRQIAGLASIGDDAEDAYTGTLNFTFNGDEDTPYAVTLHRPLAKVIFVETECYSPCTIGGVDSKEVATKYVNGDYMASISYDNTTPVYTCYNAWTQQVDKTVDGATRLFGPVFALTGTQNYIPTLYDYVFRDEADSNQSLKARTTLSFVNPLSNPDNGTWTTNDVLRNYGLYSDGSPLLLDVSMVNACYLVKSEGTSGRLKLSEN